MILIFLVCLPVIKRQIEMHQELVLIILNYLAAFKYGGLNLVFSILMTESL